MSSANQQSQSRQAHSIDIGSSSPHKGSVIQRSPIKSPVRGASLQGTPLA